MNELLDENEFCYYLEPGYTGVHICTTLFPKYANQDGFLVH